MLTLSKLRTTATKSIQRRTFLQIGAMGAFGLTLPELLRAEAATGQGGSRKAIINIHLDGGPPQMDTIDLKPAAPKEFAASFSRSKRSFPAFPSANSCPGSRQSRTASRFSAR